MWLSFKNDMREICQILRSFVRVDGRKHFCCIGAARLKYFCRARKCRIRAYHVPANDNIVLVVGWIEHSEPTPRQNAVRGLQVRTVPRKLNSRSATSHLGWKSNTSNKCMGSKSLSKFSVYASTKCISIPFSLQQFSGQHPPKANIATATASNQSISPSQNLNGQDFDHIEFSY